MVTRMSVLILSLTLLCTTGCIVKARAENTNAVKLVTLHDNNFANGIYKFVDGDTVCYVYSDVNGRSGLSCLKK